MTTILILSVVGILCLLAELVLPGGFLGVISAICLIGAVIATFVTYGATAGTIALALLVVLALISLRLWMKLFHRLPFTRQLVLNDTVGVDEELQERQTFTGRIGIALTDLHPSGRADFDGQKIDVLTEGPEIKSGSKIEVVETRGPSILVRAIPD